MKTMTTHKQAEATYRILLYATRLLLKYGRPRKLPGKMRAEAMSFGPSPVSYRSQHVRKLSASGAIKRAAFDLRDEYSKATLSRARKAAEDATVAALCGAEHPWITLEELDDAESDTRHMVRALNKAGGKFLVF